MGVATLLITRRPYLLHVTAPKMAELSMCHRGSLLPRACGFSIITLSLCEEEEDAADSSFRIYELHAH